jgi:RNA polymerase sigma factor (sigma-70 family)
MSLLLLEDDYRRLRTYDQRARLDTWLQTVVNHEVARFLQREGRTVGLKDAPPEQFLQPPDQEDLVELHEHQHLIEEARKKLTAEDQELYHLVYVEESPDKQIAQKLGCNLDAVRQRKRRLRKRLKGLVSEK